MNKILQISKNDISSIKMHAMKVYPHECCGLIAGHYPIADCMSVTKIFKAKNIAKAPEKEYLIDHELLLYAEKYCRSNQLEILGVYHSHPNYPPIPSSKDISEAVPQFVYIILSSHHQEAGEPKAWMIREHQRTEIELEILYD